MLVSAFLVSALSQFQEIELSREMAPIVSSVRIKHGIYTLEDLTGQGALKIGGDNIDVDFQGSTIQSPGYLGGRLDTFNGLGLAIEGRKHVTIRNVHIHGFQYNARALRCSSIHFQNCELGGSRSQRIIDTDLVNPIRLDVQNIESWRTYGAGLLLEKCSNCLVSGVRANQSQNGLLIVHSNRNKVFGCDFSYNSGWGIALYGSSSNLICWNDADFVNRPLLTGWGGDSAGCVLTAASSRNSISNNSLTHCGVGFLLKPTLGGFDSGGTYRVVGSCDQNMIAYNDGSWSATSAFESTFSSQNVFCNNAASFSDYGMLLSYSNRNLVQGNTIGGNRIDGIAHAQGVANSYVNNFISDNWGAAIHLWSGTEDRFRQCPSTANEVIQNRIERVKVPFDFTNSSKLYVSGNSVPPGAVPAGMQSPSTDFPVKPYELERASEIASLKPQKFRLYRDADLPTGRHWFAASTYGMRDFRKAQVPWLIKNSNLIRIWAPRDVASFQLDLPNWMVMSRPGNGRELIVSPKPNLQSVGSFRSFSISARNGAGPSIKLNGQLLDLKWRIKWLQSDSTKMFDSEGWKALFEAPIPRQETTTILPGSWGGDIAEKRLLKDRYLIQAFTDIELVPATYRFDAISDDVVQVFVDGRLVINSSTHHEPSRDSSLMVLSEGIHHIELRYIKQVGGSPISFSVSKQD